MGDHGSRRFEGVIVRTEHWPVVLMEIPERRFTDAALRETLKFHEELMITARRAAERVYVITDLSRMTELASRSQIAYTGEWLQRRASLQQATTLGVATVCPSVIQRGLLTAIAWFLDRQVPKLWVATRREACASALAALDGAGIRLRPEVTAWLSAEAAPRSGRPSSPPPAR